MWEGNHYIPMHLMDYTIRDCVKELLKLWGSNVVILNNGTRIYLHDIHDTTPIGTVRYNSDGSIRLIKRFLCTIEPVPKTKDLDSLKIKNSNNKGYKYWMYIPKMGLDNMFSKNDYLLPERIMNSFISSNGGIDHYETIGAKLMIQEDIEHFSLYDY